MPADEFGLWGKVPATFLAPWANHDVGRWWIGGGRWHKAIQVHVFVLWADDPHFFDKAAPGWGHVAQAGANGCLCVVVCGESGVNHGFQLAQGEPVSSGGHSNDAAELSGGIHRGAGKCTGYAVLDTGALTHNPPALAASVMRFEAILK